MAELRALVEGLGFRDVRTVLNSGNVVFSVPKNRRGDVAALIQKALLEKLGLNVRVTVLTGEEVAAAVRENPLTDVANNPSHLLVMVPREPSDQDRLKPLLEERWSPEVLALGRRVAYLWCARGVADSTLWPAVDRALERSGTVRNMATMTKLLALVEGS
jgi:uncharacterized protein (DUF1697 family)